MGERRPTGEKEFNPLDDSINLISSVLGGEGTQAKAVQRELGQPVEVTKLTPMRANSSSKKEEEFRESTTSKEEFVTVKFKVPRSEYAQAKKILSLLEEELQARLDLSNLGRGWITRFITAEKELLDVAKNQEKLKTPNSRNPLEVAEIDHAMAVLQSVAFRRAQPVREDSTKG